MSRSHDGGSSNSSPVWKILPTFSVSQPCCRKNCGSITAPFRTVRVGVTLSTMPVVSGLLPLRNEVRDGLQTG